MDAEEKIKVKINKFEAELINILLKNDINCDYDLVSNILNRIKTRKIVNNFINYSSRYNLTIFPFRNLDHIVFYNSLYKKNNNNQYSNYYIKIENANNHVIDLFKKEILENESKISFKNISIGVCTINDKAIECKLTRNNYNIIKNLKENDNILFVRLNLSKNTKNDYCFIIPRINNKQEFENIINDIIEI